VYVYFKGYYKPLSLTLTVIASSGIQSYHAENCLSQQYGLWAVF